MQLKSLFYKDHKVWRLFPHRAVSQTHRFCKSQAFSHSGSLFLETQNCEQAALFRTSVRFCTDEARNMDMFTSRPLLLPSLLLSLPGPLHACSGSQQERRDGSGCTCLWLMGCFSPQSLQEENSSLSSTSIWFAECNSLWENGCLVFQPCPGDGHAGENEDPSLRNLSLPFNIYKYAMKDLFSFQVAASH